MKASTENSTEKNLVKVSENKPVSVCSVNFARVINEFAGKKSFFKRKAFAGEFAARRSLSGKIFTPRNLALTTAILAIGVLHFAFQMSFIRPEVSKKRPLFEVPAINLEPVSTTPADEIKPVVIESSRKPDAPLPATLKKAAPSFKSRQAEVAPAKPQPKKKDAVESRAERLRRAEKILTGI